MLRTEDDKCARGKKFKFQIGDISSGVKKYAHTSFKLESVLEYMMIMVIKIWFSKYSFYG